MEDLEKERDLYKANLIKIFKLQMDHTQEMWEMLNTIFDRKNGDQDGNEPLPYKPRNGVFLLMEDLENMMNASYEAGRESVIANRETYQKVRAEGVREGMEKAAVLVGQAHHGGGNVFEYLSELIRKKIDND